MCIRYEKKPLNAAIMLPSILCTSKCNFSFNLLESAAKNKLLRVRPQGSARHTSQSSEFPKPCQPDGSSRRPGAQTQHLQTPSASHPVRTSRYKQTNNHVSKSVIQLRGVTYRSPLLRAELQSLSLVANSPSVHSPSRILFSKPSTIAFASSLVRVISA